MNRNSEKRWSDKQLGKTKNIPWKDYINKKPLADLIREVVGESFEKRKRRT